MNINYVCFNIQWDTDGDDTVLNDLPKSMIIGVPAEFATPESVNDYLSDKLSDKTGWCHYGFDFANE